jgi:hypothetical protein
MLKVLKSDTDPDYYTTEVQIKIPGFQTFGQLNPRDAISNTPRATLPKPR